MSHVSSYSKTEQIYHACMNIIKSNPGTIDRAEQKIIGKGNIGQKYVKFIILERRSKRQYHSHDTIDHPINN